MADFLISYSHHDDDEVATVERLLQRRGVTVIRDRRMTRGELVDEEIRRAINGSHGAILYVTPEFALSDYVRSKEIPWLRERREADPTFGVIPVFRGVTPKDVEEDERYAHLRVLPTFFGNRVTDFEGQARSAATEALHRVLVVKRPAIVARGHFRLRIDARGPATLVAPDLHLNWQDLFGAGRAATPAEWETDVLPALEDLKAALDRAIGPIAIQLDGRLSLAASFAVGQHFPVLSGYRLHLTDPTGVTLDVSTGAHGSTQLRIDAPALSGGSDLAVTVSISQPIGAAAADWLGRENAKARIDIAADFASNRFIRDGAHLNAVADEIAQAIRRVRAEQGTRGIRLAMVGPAALALALGVRLKAVGPIRFPDYQNSTDSYVQTAVFA